MPRNSYDVTPEQFIFIWQTSETPQEAADKLKMPRPIVLARATGYRRRGIPLKAMPRRGRRTVDVEKLKRLAEELVGREQGRQGPNEATTESGGKEGGHESA